MAVNETVGINLVVDTKSLRGQLREATLELVKLQNTAGATGADIAAAAKRAAELRDRIGDAKDTIAAFDPDAKFKAFGQSIQGVAGAFAATQGALALVGVESAEVEKQLLKVQGALALSEGLNTVLASIDGFKNLGLVLKENVVAGFAAMRAAAVTAFTTVRGALIATGVGAFAVALGLIITNFDAIKEAVLKVIPSLANVGKIFSDIVTKVTDFVGITNEAERSLEKFTKASVRKKESLEAELKVMEAAGASEKDLSDKRKQIVNNDLNVLREKLKTTGKLSDEEYKKFRELKTDLTVIDTKYNKSVTDGNNKKNEELAKQNQEADEKLIAQAKKRQEDLTKAAEDSRDEYEKNQARIKKEDEDLRNRNSDQFLSDQEKEVEAAQVKYEKLYQDRLKFGGDIAEVEAARLEEINNINAKFEQQELERLSDKTEETVQIKKKGEEDETKTVKAQTNARIKLGEAEKQAKLNNLKAASDVFGALAGLAEQGTATQKALSLAQIALNTGIAIANLTATTSAPTPDNLATGGISGFAKYAAGIITILANVAQAKSIIDSIPGGGGGSSASIPSMGAGAGAPIAPRAAEPTATTLDQTSLNTISNVVSRAYVVESDITGSQQRISRIEKASRF